MLYSENKSKTIFNNFSLTVESGETVALVGASGSGKSTLLNLIPRFYDVSKGSVSIDDINVKNFDLKTLREYISTVPQEPFLTRGTILENIRLVDLPHP